MINIKRFRTEIEKYGEVKEFAKAGGTSRNFVYEVLAGRKTPSVRVLVKWASVLGVSVDDLLDNGAGAAEFATPTLRLSAPPA